MLPPLLKANFAVLLVTLHCLPATQRRAENWVPVIQNDYLLNTAQYKVPRILAAQVCLICLRTRVARVTQCRGHLCGTLAPLHTPDACPCVHHKSLLLAKAVMSVRPTQAGGSACFDVDHYLASNADLQGELHGADEAWHHFVFHGQFETRPHRYGIHIAGPT